MLGSVEQLPSYGTYSATFRSGRSKRRRRERKWILIWEYGIWDHWSNQTFSRHYWIKGRKGDEKLRLVFFSNNRFTWNIINFQPISERMHGIRIKVRIFKLIIKNCSLHCRPLYRKQRSKGSFCSNLRKYMIGIQKQKPD